MAFPVKVESISSLSLSSSTCNDLSRLLSFELGKGSCSHEKLIQKIHQSIDDFFHSSPELTPALLSLESRSLIQKFTAYSFSHLGDGEACCGSLGEDLSEKLIRLKLLSLIWSYEAPMEKDPSLPVIAERAPLSLFRACQWTSEIYNFSINSCLKALSNVGKAHALMTEQQLPEPFCFLISSQRTIVWRSSSLSPLQLSLCDLWGVPESEKKCTYLGSSEAPLSEAQAAFFQSNGLQVDAFSQEERLSLLETLLHSSQEVTFSDQALHPLILSILSETKEDLFHLSMKHLPATFSLPPQVLCLCFSSSSEETAIDLFFIHTERSMAFVQTFFSHSFTSWHLPDELQKHPSLLTLLQLHLSPASFLPGLEEMKLLKHEEWQDHCASFSTLLDSCDDYDDTYTRRKIGILIKDFLEENEKDFLCYANGIYKNNFWTSTRLQKASILLTTLDLYIRTHRNEAVLLPPWVQDLFLNLPLQNPESSLREEHKAVLHSLVHQSESYDCPFLSKLKQLALSQVDLKSTESVLHQAPLFSHCKKICFPPSFPPSHSTVFELLKKNKSSLQELECHWSFFLNKDVQELLSQSSNLKKITFLMKGEPSSLVEGQTLVPSFKFLNTLCRTLPSLTLCLKGPLPRGEETFFKVLQDSFQQLTHLTHMELYRCFTPLLDFLPNQIENLVITLPPHSRPPIGLLRLMEKHPQMKLEINKLSKRKN